ncbi:MAG: 7-cyano-7-deazaguanine synthase QueC [Myxococcota bacterium]
MTDPDRAVVLLSGGLDSAVTLAIARSRGLDCFCLSFDYGQRHRHELSAAAKVACSLGAREHKTLTLDLRAFGGSALTADIDVPKGREADAMADIPITYVPARNLVFLSLAMGYAEVSGASSLYIGVNALDYSGYPDCRPEFVASFQQTAALATRVGVEGEPITIEAPLIEMTKAEIVQAGARHGADLGLTHSCYDPDPAGLACGACDSCVLRRNGFRDAGVADPTRYAGV